MHCVPLPDVRTVQVPSQEPACPAYIACVDCSTTDDNAITATRPTTHHHASAAPATGHHMHRAKAKESARNIRPTGQNLQPRRKALTAGRLRESGRGGPKAPQPARAVKARTAWEYGEIVGIGGDILGVCQEPGTGSRFHAAETCPRGGRCRSRAARRLHGRWTRCFSFFSRSPRRIFDSSAQERTFSASEEASLADDDNAAACRGETTAWWWAVRWATGRGWGRIARNRYLQDGSYN